jgi:histidyl-tRNA synthetase
MHQINVLTNVMFQTAKSWGYVQIEGPTLQPVEFYKAKSSDELLKDGYYVSASDHEYMLRPEITPTVAYMLAEAEKSLTYPVRWFSNPQLYRNERPQSGRRRQFGQFNLDRFDMEPMTSEARALADAEVVSEAIETLSRYGLTKDDVVVKINSRSVIEQVFALIGIDDRAMRDSLLTVIDAKNKLSYDDFVVKLKNNGCSEEQISKLQEWFSIENLGSIDPSSQFSSISETDEYKELTAVFELLSKYGFGEFIIYDPVIVRGLGYYTGTVFEAFDRTPEKSMGRAILGGGRYNKLTMKFGGKLELSGVGYGMGHVPLEAVLQSRELLALESNVGPDYYITTEEDPEYSRSERMTTLLQMSKIIRSAGQSVIIDSSITTAKEGRLKKQLSNADKSKALTVLILLNDQSRGIAVKDFSSSTQSEISVEDFIAQFN